MKNKKVVLILLICNHGRRWQKSRGHYFSLSGWKELLYKQMISFGMAKRAQLGPSIFQNWLNIRHSKDRISVNWIFQISGQAPRSPNCVRIFLRIGGSRLGLRLHSPYGQITELEKFRELLVDNWQHCPFLLNFCGSIYEGWKSPTTPSSKLFISMLP